MSCSRGHATVSDLQASAGIGVAVLMVDVFDRAKRSEVMSKVKSKDTKPEMTLRKALYKTGLRGYRVKTKLPGSPDIVFTRVKVAVFVDGCFWHGCPECYSEPGTNVTFWRKKLAENRERDAKVNKMLADMGWKVLRLWEHQIEKDLKGCIDAIKALISGDGHVPSEYNAGSSGENAKLLTKTGRQGCQTMSVDPSSGGDFGG